METLELNYLAIVAAALANFVVGGLWYSPALFGGPWMRATPGSTRGWGPPTCRGSWWSRCCCC